MRNPLTSDPPRPVVGFGPWRQPNLVGLVCGSDEKPVEAADGGQTLIDLNGGKLTWHPAQQIQLSWRRPDWQRAEDCHPFVYALTFTKARGDATGDWIRANAESLRFRIADVLFAVDVIDGDAFSAHGWRVRT